MISNACVELNRKSLMVEEAVEEVLDLVKKAAQQIKPTETNPDFEFLTAEGKYNNHHPLIKDQIKLTKPPLRL